MQAMTDDTKRSTWSLELSSEAETQALARFVANMLAADDLVTLSGDLGSGKTAFARALIRCLTKDPGLEVPSPTFTLMQLYQTQTFPIVHADLYRLRGPDDLAELGWDEAAEGALVMVEWADRAGDELPQNRLDVALQMNFPRGEEARHVLITGMGAFAARLDRAKALHALLEASGWAQAERSFMLGDASTRAYERLRKPDGERAILMISPPRPDGPPIRFGKPYSAIARLAENVTPFVALANALRAQQLSAPEIFASDIQAGLAILEDLGSEGFVDENGPIAERYAEAVAVLASLHARRLPETLLVGDSATYSVPPYDMEALTIEVELLLEWYLPAYARNSVASGAQAQFTTIWRKLFEDCLRTPSTWTLRDYHSPNLIWLPQRTGLRRVGIIDFQDCVLGNPAYDLASLLQDARVTVGDELELRLLSHYARKRREADADFNMAAFARDYALLGAQRATKILGIFARLDKRDGKPQYLAHLPRVEAYLSKDLAHPALAEIRAWYAEHLPALAPS